ncbi:peptidylprolyl isomerase [Mollicutes bacterium LVI A0039]|nr:peptidylprolyl isomerase [Mollicutes bacterium LVI A0039]
MEKKLPIATIEFEQLGTVKLELFLDTPNSTNNFISLASKGYYDGLSMHRIIPDFVAQGGCPNGTGMGGPGYTIDGEFPSNGFDNPHPHDRGVIAWARSMARNSAGSQFYITLGDTHFLNADYAVFGQVVEGLEVLDELNKLGTGGGTPIKPVTIKCVTIDTHGEVYPEPMRV